MCGIVGGISGKINGQIARKMTSKLAERGPDGEGIFFDQQNNVFLGHRRLKIIDLSEKGSQPMQFENFFICYNGEVYNHKEIRAELEKKGHKFESDSDTEVVLKSFAQWGVLALRKFRGMFAFAIWDKSKKKIFLFRDRFGVKPLYFYLKKGDFLFASQIKSLLEFPGLVREINPEALNLYFRFGYIKSPQSIFKNIFKLEPGCFLEIDSDLKIKKGRYWSAEKYFDLSEDKKKEKFFEKIGEEEISKELESILLESFQYRMVSDVDVGIFLSAGVDSSLLASLLAKNNSQKLKTFTIGFEDEVFDEAKEAKKIAGYLKTEHYEHYFSQKDLLETIGDFKEAFDEPFGDASSLPTLLLAKFAGQKVKVALSGDGGDELFFGYSKYRALLFWKRLPAAARWKIKTTLKILGPEKTARIYSFLPIFGSFSNFEAKLKKLSHLPIRGDFLKIIEGAGNFWSEREISSLLAPGFNLKNSGYDFLPEMGRGAKNILEKSAGLKSLSRENFSRLMQVWDIENYLEGDILAKTDRAGMRFGLETREPYLDEKIISFSSRLPLGLKLKKNRGKYLLKKLLEKHLPRELIGQIKSGFTPNISRLISDEILGEYLNISKIKKQGIINPEIVENILKQKESGHRVDWEKLWVLLCFQIWAERWI